jgi:hypothetical protein
LNIDILNAHCGLGSLPEPRLSEGWQTDIATVNARRVPPACTLRGVVSRTDLRVGPVAVGVSRPRSVGPEIVRSIPLPRGFAHPYQTCRLEAFARSGRANRLCQLPETRRGGDVARFVSLATPSTPAATAEWWRREASQTKKPIQPRIRRDYPLNLSISVSGGKETNKDSLSNGE